MTDNYVAHDANNLAREIELLMEAHPDLAEDDILRADMLEGETDLHRVLDRLVGYEREAATMAAAIAARVSDLQARAARHVKMKDAMRGLMLKLMKAASLPKLTLPEATISVRKGGTSVEVDDVDLPPEYTRAVVTADKTKIGALLKSGTEFEWARLVTGPATLAVKAR